MAKKDLPDIETLRNLLRYESETGKLYWLPRTPDMFLDGRPTRESACKTWNSRFAGKEAFTSITLNGYKQGTLFGKGGIKAHIIAYAIYYGEIPTNEIDHINGMKADNRICNLREATRSQQAMNIGLGKNNSSGVRGVGWNKRKNKWMVRICAKGKKICLGYFTDFDEAVAIRKRAEPIYHGDYVRK